VKRDLGALTAREHDLLIVGGGIHGAAAAWDAAQRGLSVALVEAHDFGSGVSWNSLKTIHGGIRHLQRADLLGLRESVRERRALLRIAPEIVKPLPFLIPTYGHGLKGREALAAALLLNDVVGYDRNRGLQASARIPPGRTLGTREVLDRVPGMKRRGLSGGAVWTDGQVQSGERLILGFLHSASELGAVLANHVEVFDLLRLGARVTGVCLRDELTGTELEIRARMVLNAAGPNVDGILATAGLTRPRVPLLRATNLVLRRPPDSDHAVGASCGGRYLFLVPWQGRTMVGTAYDPAEAGEDVVVAFFEEARRAFPWVGLERGDVELVHQGLVPGDGRGLWTRHRLLDHEARDGLAGLVSIVGVKYTTARGVAEQALDLVLRRSGRAGPACRTATTTLTGAAPLSGSLVEQTRRAVHDEMALSLSDAVLRRLDLGTAAPPDEETLGVVVETMGSELDWNGERIHLERQSLAEAYAVAVSLRSG
jgi:glycerol-3-phosphate dehydrogenase